MSEHRLSKLQKWILENCFRVTVLLDRAALKKLNHIGDSRKCKTCPKTKEEVRLSRNQHNALQHRCGDGFCPYFCFYKEDVLLSYFSLIPNNDMAHFSRVQHFHDSPDYSKAHVTVHRSINGLIDKGFVYTWNTFPENSQEICLTDDGVRKAAELLKINDYELPDNI